MPLPIFDWVDFQEVPRICFSNRSLGVLCVAVFVSALALGVNCGDNRDKIIKEYVDGSLAFLPQCSDFTQNGHSSHFSFKELNTGDYTWAILRDNMLKGIEDTRTNYGGSALAVNSGYRNPVHNSGISGSATDSRHIHGDAVDFQSDQTAWDSLRKAGKKAGACSEPQTLSGWGHVHVDWRGDCPLNW
jgi:hypothetical protein